MSSLPRFLIFYAALFAAFGAASPFLPSLLQQEGLGPTQLGIVLAAGTAIRVVAGPLGGRMADRIGHIPTVLAGFTAASALVALGYAPARGILMLLLVSVAHAAVLAPLTPISDALALGSSQNGIGFRYGWVRGAGSAAFIAGTLVAGQIVGRTGLGSIVWLNGGLLTLAACVAWLLPNRVAGSQPGRRATDENVSAWSLARIPVFVQLMGIAALIGGSHSLHDGFEVIRWRAAGMSAGQISILWSLSVAAEVAVFAGFGPRLLELLGPRRAMVLSACAGVIRWGTAARTAWFPAMAIVEPLHGLTFAMLHLACMGMIARVIPPRLAATAQALYATVAMGATAALVTAVSGPLYGTFGAASFWTMALMCALSVPLALTIKSNDGIFDAQS
jgi:PPP family 3-phenylpropionic acid transporter